MIVFTSCNSKLDSHKFAQECIEKYLYISKFTNKKIATNKKTEILKFKNNKPYINNELKISISNKELKDKKINIVAISLNEVGIDCEIRNNFKNRQKIIDKFFTEKEKEKSKTVYDFFVIWTQKEAVYKSFDNIEKLAVKIDTDKYLDNLTTFDIYDNVIVSIYSKDKNIYVYEMEDKNSYGKTKKINS